MNLTLTDIEKSFGVKKVLDKVSFHAESGSAFGLLGRNGAGKTTSIRIAMGVFPPDAGSVSVDGGQVSQSGVSFGYLPEERGLYPKHPIGVQLAYIGMLRGMNRHDAQESAKKNFGDGCSRGSVSSKARERTRLRSHRDTRGRIRAASQFTELQVFV